MRKRLKNETKKTKNTICIIKTKIDNEKNTYKIAQKTQNNNLKHTK